MHTHPLIAGLDVGTTNIKALIVEPDGQVVASASTPTPTHHPRTGWAFYDPDELWGAVCRTIREATESISARDRITSIAVASVGETGFPVGLDGQATHNGIAWFDTRTEPQAQWLRDNIGAETIYQACRMSIQPIYGLCKLLWLRDNEPAVIENATWLNAADYIAFKLSGEYVSEPSLASRALLYEVDKRSWAVDLLAACDLSPDLLPPLKPSGTGIGTVTSSASDQTGLTTSTVVATGGHDHVCGALGVGVVSPGTILNSLGTAEAHFLPIDQPLNRPEVARQGYSVGGHVAGDRFYAIGGLYASGGSVDWVKSLLGASDGKTLLREAHEVPPGADGVMFLPHLRIANPPFGDAPSKGAFVGLTGDTNRASVYRAVLEGIALEANLCLRGLLSYAGVEDPSDLIAIGGSTRNILLMDIKAAVYGRPITVAETEESTALGAAILGGLGAGVYADLADVLSIVIQERHVIEPDATLVERYADITDRYNHVYPALKPLNARISET